MDSIATENLFLLEFLVDDVDVKRECDCELPEGELCVSFQFLDNAPLDVCEGDFAPKRSYGNESGKIKSGKSCLFSLSPKQAEEAINQFDIDVSIFKRMPSGWLPEKLLIGTTLISIVNVFNELIDSIGCGCDAAPCAKTLKDVFKVTDTAGEDIGTIGVYIRMSCFGKLIVTQFQMNLEDKSVLFKDKEGHSLYKYKKASKSSDRKGGECMYNTQCPEVPCPPPTSRDIPCNTECPNVPCPQPQPPGGGFPQMQYNANCPTVSCFSPPGQMPNQGGPCNPQCPNVPCFPQPQQNYQTSPCNECGMAQNNPMMMMQTPCNECGQMGQMGQTRMEPPCNECGLPPQPMEDPANAYEEIGAQMGGNALTIRVHKDKNHIEQIENNEQIANDGCPCSIGNVGGKAPVESRNYNINPGLNMGGGQQTPFALKMGGQGCGNNNVTVVPPVCTAPDGTQYTELSDPDKDVFILRIGKKNEGTDRKANLELELCTPKGPDLKPIPKKETRDTQYDETDAGEGGGKGKKGKKGDKGGKKGGKGGKKGKKK